MDKPINNEEDIFKKLTRLVSGGLARLGKQNYHNEHRRDLEKYKKRYRTTSGKEYQSLKMPVTKKWLNYQREQNRFQRYQDFDEMDFYPEISKALDIYAGEMVTSTLLTPILDITSKNEEIKGILNDLYYNVLNVEHNLFPWCRSYVKNGDWIGYLETDIDLGVTNVIQLPIREVERLEGEDETNSNYVQYQWNGGGLTFERWQVMHFRNLSNDKYAPYGTSILDGSRQVFRQLILLEDAMMTYRVVRSPERRLFKIDVGNIPDEQIEQFMEQTITSLKRNQIIDPETGRVDLRFNPLSAEEDIFLPVREGSQTSVDTLAGGQFTGVTEDVEYILGKLLMGLGIPSAYLNQSGDVSEDKVSLTQKDIEFAKHIQRLQRPIVSELKLIGIIHLFILGFRGEDLLSFDLKLSNPSKIAELQELEHFRTKMDIATSASDKFFPVKWIYDNIFGFSHQEQEKLILGRFHDRKIDVELESISNMARELEGMADMSGGGLGDDLGGDLGALGDEELGDESLPATPEMEAGEGGGGLLSTPGKRLEREDKVKFSDGTTTTKRSKGKKYKPESNDNRKNISPRKKKFKGMWADSMGRSTKRNVVPGLSSLKITANDVFESNSYNDDLILENKETEEFLKEIERVIQ